MIIEVIRNHTLEICFGVFDVVVLVLILMALVKGWRKRDKFLLGFALVVGLVIGVMNMTAWDLATLTAQDKSLNDIKDKIIVQDKELSIGVLPQGYQYKDNKFDSSKIQTFEIIQDDSRDHMYLKHKDNGEVIELNREDMVWVRVKQIKESR